MGRAETHRLEARAKVGERMPGPIARRCERAVLTAYRELREAGSDDLSAFRACTTLYRVHHPEASIAEARRLVAEWVDRHLGGGAPGPTDGCPCG